MKSRNNEPGLWLAVFASLQLSLFHQSEAPQIQDNLGDWIAEICEEKSKKRQLFGVDSGGANLMLTN